MKAVLLSAIVAAALVSAGAAQASPDLAKSAGCVKCHDMDKTKKGAPGIQGGRRQVQGQGRCRRRSSSSKINDPKGDHPEMKAKPDDVKAVVKWMLSL